MRHGQCTCTRSVSICQLLRENINKIRFDDEKQTKISTTTAATHKCARKNKKIGDIAHSKYVAKNSYSKVTHKLMHSDRVSERASERDWQPKPRSPVDPVLPNIPCGVRNILMANNDCSMIYDAFLGNGWCFFPSLLGLCVQLICSFLPRQQCVGTTEYVPQYM